MNLYTLDDPINATGPAFFAEPRYAHTHTSKHGSNNKSASFSCWCIRQWVFLKTQDLILVFLFSIKAAQSHLEEKEKSFLQRCTMTAKEELQLGLIFLPFYISWLPIKSLSLFNLSVPKLVASQP